VANPSVQAQAESAKLAMFGDCCIDSTERLTEHHEQLLRALEEGAGVELDMAGISRMDTAGIQLVLAFVLEMKQQSRDVVIAAASDVVRQSAKSAGVAEMLGV
jgi:ABC-type transporter Mla MlaB component